MAEPHGGGGTGLLAFVAVLFAGFLFAGIAFALFLSNPQATPTPVLGADVSPTSSLEIFIQPTASPSPPPTPSPLPSFFLTPTPGLTLPIDSGLITPFPSATIPVVTPVPTPTVPRTPRPTPAGTPTPPPTPPPLSCAGADGSNMKSIVIGTGNAPSVGPTNKAWCIHQVTIRPYPEGFPEPGRTQLLLNGRKIAATTCAAEGCDVYTRNFAIPRLAQAGSTLSWNFECIDNPNTVEDECTDASAGGSTIEIQYEGLPGT